MSLKKRPGTALSVVTEFSGSGLLNPKPAEDPEDQRLSPHRLVRAQEEKKHRTYSVKTLCYL